LIERSFQVANIPLLAMAQDDRPRPAVLMYHGLHSQKEAHRTELLSLAGRGFLALGVDAIGHGQRALPDLKGFLQRGSLLGQASKMLRPSFEEIPLLLDFLEAEGYGPFGLCGISFGAMLVYAAPQRESRVKAITAILGDPTWCDPYARLESYSEVALLAWNGGCDVHVPPEPARNFLSELQRRYGSDRLRYREYAESNHFMRPEDWADGWEHSLQWFERHLT